MLLPASAGILPASERRAGWTSAVPGACLDHHHSGANAQLVYIQCSGFVTDEMAQLRGCNGVTDGWVNPARAGSCVNFIHHM
jgi:hypothetical protein